MNFRWVADNHDADSLSQLQPFYQRRLIPAEKKPFLVDLARSFGSNLAVHGGGAFIHDLCSQIATAGLGFNASALFAPCQHLESWTGDYTTENIRAIADSYRGLLKRLLGPAAADHHVHFCASGAEAIEISLGVCFENRVNRTARKVLAFEGSFHGRMLVALSASWNPKKREPFAWPGYESDFAPWPTATAGIDSAAAERHALAIVRQKLETGQFYAILLEPMQCEGGDRYSSPAFHRQLVNLARSFEVPVVYDEVQTGFHLGDRFFWHSQFILSDHNSLPIAPDVIACAKKAQIGIVISRFPVPYRETFCPASLIRGCASAWMIDQYDDLIRQTGELIRDQLAALVARYEPLIGNPRSQGTAVAFDFQDADTLHRFVQSRFDHGLLFYPAGERTARFRLNLSSGMDDLALLWRQLDRCLAHVFSREPEKADASAVTVPKIDSPESSYRFHVGLAEAKRMRMLNLVPESAAALDYLQRELRDSHSGQSFEVVVLDANNYPKWRKHILRMQTVVYEPVRQTPAEEFDALFNNGHPIDSPALLLVAAGEIAAMAFCGPLASFSLERGVTDDPYFQDARTFYMLDLTVAPDYRSLGLGRVMKNALTMLAAERGVQAIHGRNRDRLARAMWTINLGLGSFELQHLSDDYPDEHRFRDCIYYRCPLTWREQNAEAKLPFAQLDVQQIDERYFLRNAPSLVNKTCLSNFVTRNFLDDLEIVSQVIPAPLRHLYTASSLSESIDKVAKAIWLKRQPRTGLLTVEGHFFGAGSFLARSLSGVGESYFDVARINEGDLLRELERQLKEDRWLAFFVETDRVTESRNDRASQHIDDGIDLLAQIVRLCRAAGVPVVFNETCPRFGSDRQDSRMLESKYQLLPDAGVVWLGGQMSLSYTNDYLFADDPLLLISTWDGDAYGLARFAETVRQMRNAETGMSL